ncbi:hypothetical protein TSH58p_30050 (plasmid) [Azospirillum sp. TSH58]|uniref:hypothetical protein n=1 Tax=Azospirillum sp. TSH58 TaxID=664962 RepID=UPI000D601CCE|nr:hypothetical protein [Azospirillum sp. TSH58]AWJ87757.1 hypothetical protein TSH58p_30050 [Azospirillum sp. TSH58]PWC62114.1 hypothetical protein TSH58_25660 [Azospirillum sp. TSH58]
MSDETPAKRIVYHRANDGTVVGWTNLNADGTPSSHCYGYRPMPRAPRDPETPPRSSLPEQTSFPTGSSERLVYSPPRAPIPPDDDTQDR